ncbi:MAG: class B sortase [Lachnospiraceae bacterium]|nr:class B sortase [Lachnospiraceae bacterium]
MKKSARVALIIIFAVGLIISGYQLQKDFRETAKEALVKNALLVYRPPQDSGEEEIRQSFLTVREEINDDIIGWLSIFDTRIDYPLVKGTDNDYYLSHDIYRNKSASGSLFVDYRCPDGFAGTNTIIYGHNMRNGNMLYDLRKFTNADFFNRNLSFTIIDDDGIHVMDIFAFMVIPDDEIIYNPLAEPETIIAWAKENAVNYRDPAGEAARLVTISTCAYDYEDARMVLLAIPQAALTNTSLTSQYYAPQNP